MAKQPILYLVGGPPTLEDIAALAEKLTGRKPTDEEYAEVAALYRELRPTTP